MPRIDPLQLLTCLSVLLKPDGGIRSRDEVPRLVSLMTKFSKKLVSKCIYSLILKNTETSLVDMFMAEGGWQLVETWIQDGIQTSNWHLMEEILDLLLITPVDVDRLKLNCLPKIIKSLSRREDLHKVAQLSSQIVQNWLYVVKETSNIPKYVPIREGSSLDCGLLCDDSLGESTVAPLVSTVDLNFTSTDFCSNADTINTDLGENIIKPTAFYKVAVKGGKQVIRKLSVEEQKLLNDSNSHNKVLLKRDAKSDDKNKEKRSRSSKLHSHRDKERDRTSRHSSTDSRSKSSSNSKSPRDRHKDKHRDRHSSSSSSSLNRKDRSSSSFSSNKGSLGSSKDRDKRKEKIKENQHDKDKNTLEKLKPQTLDKLGRIPKKSTSPVLDNKHKESQPDIIDNVQKKKPSFSILNKKASGEERIKTVKIYNSKMRSTGLEEEAKPPPPRSAKRSNTTSIQLPTFPPKRPSTEPFTTNISEKKLKFDKIDVPERPGAIKLIAPKPKPAVLQESDMFMDALKASAPKKDRKRKRVPSLSKESPTSTSTTLEDSPQLSKMTTTAAVTDTVFMPKTNVALKSIAPINFYQDTLVENTDEPESKTEPPSDETTEEPNLNCDVTPPSSPIPIKAEIDDENDEIESDSTPKIPEIDELKGVLLYTKKKGPKKSIQWKEEENLVEIRYFELDETERVNVTKNFIDMAKMELSSEREALMMSRKVNSDDLMEPQIPWHKPRICDQPEILVAPGSKSAERDVQFAREKASLPALYFDKRKIPDSPEEPPSTTLQMSDPTVIPLDDPEGQEVDLRSTPWPEPKGQQPPPPTEVTAPPPVIPNVPFSSTFNSIPNIPPPTQFPIPPRYSAPPIHQISNPPMGPGPAPPFPPSNINIGMPPMNPEILNQPPMNPNMFVPPPNGFLVNRNEPNYPLPQFNNCGPNNQGPNMYMHNNFNNRGGNRGGFRGRGGNNNNGSGGGWVRMPGPSNWKRGGGSRGGRLCKNIQNHGYCRNGDNCAFIHPS